MDVFRMLARSTNVQKSDPASKRLSNPRVPSSGVIPNPQHNPLDDDFYLQNEALVSRGVKRKRNEVERKQGHDFPEAFILSGDTGQDASFSVVSAKTPSQASSERRPSCQSIENIRDVTPKLSEEECRRTLRRHKLKVIILQDSREIQGRKAAVQEPPGNKSKKKNYNQISPQPLKSFNLLRSKYGLSKRLLGNVKTLGYIEPTDVQVGSLPLLLGSDEDLGLPVDTMKTNRTQSRSELDLLTIAPTGSGKTLCFMLGLLHNLLKARRAKRNMVPEGAVGHQVQALVIAPTHELADQIVSEGKLLAMGTGVRVSVLRKGTGLQPRPVNEKDRVDKNCEEATIGRHGKEDPPMTNSVVAADVLVSTPLRLLNVISATKSPDSLSNIRFLVFDEADVLLDQMFREQTLAIWAACTHPLLRTSLWSATVGSSIESLAQSFIMERRRKLHLDSKHHFIIRLVVGLKDTAISNVSHRLVYTASENGKLLALRQLLHPHAGPTIDTPSLQPPFLIFVQTIPRAIALQSELLYDVPMDAGGPSRIAVLHSDLSDTARSRIIAGFRKGEIWILITTDLLSRGVDFRGMNGVVNYDIPTTGTSYIHRVGRTGRQGREGGVAVTFYTEEDIPFVKNVANIIAASEKLRMANSGGAAEGKDMQNWLCDALPNVSKRTKKALKSKGAESRRATAGGEDRTGGRKTRISTKSGYDRRLEDKRKGALLKGRRPEVIGSLAQVSAIDDEWEGIGT